MTNLSRSFPWLVLALAAVYLVLMMAPAEDSPSQMQVHAFSRIPVVERGRIKPIDTLARTSLMIISKRQTFQDETGQEQPAIKWLLDVMSSLQSGKRQAEKYKVFRIENDQLLRFLGLEARRSFRYAIAEFADKLKEIEERARRAEKLEANQRDLFDEKILELARHLHLYIGLAQLQTDTLRLVPPESANDEWKSYAEIEQASQHMAAERIRSDLAGRGLDLSKMSDAELRPVLAKFHTEVDRARADISPAAQALTAMLRAYAAGQADRFNQAVADYPRFLAYVPPENLSKAGCEVFFNHFEPFYQCTLLYVLVFLLACAGWLVFTEPLNRAAFWLVVLTLLVHTWALGMRMYLQGRPPVTNLYSAAVWIAWGCVLLGIFLETMYQNGVGNVVAAVTGSLSMLLAHHLAGGGDTLEMMQAVLDTNFWLATHVTVVTFGYVATVVAGVIGALYVVCGVLTPRLTRELARSLAQMIYGVLCFATLLSFTGTVLGGIWADQSWGRFWGWDPKENGALLLVLWNALILHARWAGMIKQRGMAVLAIFGIMLTGWSGIGTNQLGVGLHAYGFNNTLAMMLVGCWAACLLLIVLGLLPIGWWRSFAAQQPELPRPTKARGRSDAPVVATSS